MTPLVRKLAADKGVDLATVTGTGVGGRIRKEDVLAAAERAAAPVPAAPAPAAAAPAAAAPAAAAPAAAAAAPAPKAAAPAASKRGTTEKVSRLRATVAKRMKESLQVSAQLTATVEVDLTVISGIRAKAKDAFKAREGASLSYLPFIAKAAVEALKDFPKINASIYGTNIILRKDINIGCAVALADESLVVPVVKHADRLSFPEIAQELARLIDIARRKQLKREDVDNGTFTISNFGSFGSLIGTPIINQPQVAILGMGAVRKAPVVVNGQIVVRDQLYLSFSFDHRIIDGEQGGRFLNAIEKATAALTEESLSVEKL